MRGTSKATIAAILLIAASLIGIAVSDFLPPRIEKYLAPIGALTLGIGILAFVVLLGVSVVRAARERKRGVRANAEWQTLQAMLRWTAVAPAAVAGAIGLWFLLGLLRRGIAVGTVFDAVAIAATGGVAVLIAALVAPSRRGAVACGAAGLTLLGSAALLWTGNTGGARPLQVILFGLGAVTIGVSVATGIVRLPGRGRGNLRPWAVLLLILFGVLLLAAAAGAVFMVMMQSLG